MPTETRLDPGLRDAVCRAIHTLVDALERGRTDGDLLSHMRHSHAILGVTLEDYQRTRDERANAEKADEPPPF